MRVLTLFNLSNLSTNFTVMGFHLFIWLSLPKIQPGVEKKDSAEKESAAAAKPTATKAMAFEDDDDDDDDVS